jgi:transposase
MPILKVGERGNPYHHVRRPFYELAAAGPAPIASEMLERIKALYAIEADLKGSPAEHRTAARQARSLPLLAAMEAWLRATLPTVSQKGKLAEAIRYVLARWEGLTRFADDGTIEIDSNVVERSIRPIALTRKNALFAGSDGGAEHWAVLASLVETCKLNAVDPQAYFGATIIRIVQGHPQSQIDDLLPWAYTA